MIKLPRSRSALLRWTAVLTGVTLAFTLGSTPAQAATTDPPTVVSLTFDDGNANQLAAKTILDQNQMKGTFFITTGWIDAPTYLTRANLTTLKADGHEIAAHSVSHPDLTTQSIEEATKQICQSRASLADWGFPTTSFAYPFASVSPEVEAAVQTCGFNSARNLGDITSRLCPTDCVAVETMPPTDPFQTKALDQVDSTWTLADLQDAVTNAETAGGGWVQFTFHHVCADACDPLNLTITPALLTEFTTWLAQRTPTSAGSTTNTVVKTVGEVVGGAVKAIVPSTNTFRAAPGPGVNGVLNPGLETPGAVGGPPQCWQEGGYGVSTATFATVTTAHTGTAAEQLTVTALTAPADKKMVLTQDLGTCAPSATPGHTYSLRAWYTSTTTTQFDLYYRNAVGGWIYWTSSPYFAAATAYTQAIWQTPVVPAGATGISFGLNLIGVGTLVTDDYALYDSVGAPVVAGAVTPSRVAGADRYLTAVQNSNPAYAPGVQRVYVATGLNYPDALSAAPAAAHFASPLLLTTPNALPAEVRAEIVRLNPGLIVIVGGPSVVSDAVAADLATIKPIRRLAGADRYGTSQAIALDAFGAGATPAAYIATGENFPDALSASPAAAVFNGPLLLVPGTASVPDAATTTTLATLGVGTVRIAGGPSVVSTGLEDALRATPGITSVLRNSGADRYATAAAINQDAFASSDTVFLAVGTNFPDALVGAARAGWQKSALFLTPTACLDATAAAGMQRLGTTKVILLGGPSVLSAGVESLTPCA